MYDEKLWAGRGLFHDALVFNGVRSGKGSALGFLSIYTVVLFREMTVHLDCCFDGPPCWIGAVCVLRAPEVLGCHDFSSRLRVYTPC